MENLQIVYNPVHNPRRVEIEELSIGSAAREYCHRIEWVFTEIGLTRRQIVPHFIVIERDMDFDPRAIWIVEVIIDEEEAQIAKAQGHRVYRIDEQANYKRL